MQEHLEFKSTREPRNWIKTQKNNFIAKKAHQDEKRRLLSFASV